MNRPILIEGSSCWQVARAERVAFVVDGKDYFAAIHETILRARHNVFIVGWDIHSQLELIRPGEGRAPQTLGTLLDTVARDKPELDIYILSWDFAMIYAMEREFFPQYKLRWKSHDRVHFFLDGEHPVGASHHQKIVVVDDRVAFSGGIDLSKWRWDTSAHRIEDELRRDPSGKAYPPFHDVQMAVDGEAARALGTLVRGRWHQATTTEAKNRDDTLDSDPWPPSLEPTLTEVDVGIARTLPAYEGREEVREVEQLYLDSIDAAEQFIYIENQYLSSHRIGQALAKRLREPDGPEVVAVTPEETGGWLEQHTMDVLRARLLRGLRDADQHGRLRVYAVRLSEDPEVSLMIHAKVMVIDDSFLRIGSSNLSNRSMGFDSECDLAVESTPSRDCCDGIAGFRRRLLAEHLGVSVDEVAQAERRHRSMIAAIESLRGNERSLEPLRTNVPSEVDELVPDATLLDPESPVGPDELLDYFVTPEEQKRLRRNLHKLAVLSAALLAFVAAWRWTPLSDLLDIDKLTAMGEWLKSQPFTPLLALATFVTGGAIGIPITLLIVATVVVFDPWLGAAYALLGAELAALASFGLGHVLGRDAVNRLAGSRINRISRRLGDRGVLATITLRIVPVAPFAVINVIAGVSAIRFRDFALGNLIGMVPAVLFVALLTDRVVASLRDPGTGTAAAVLVAIAVVAGVTSWLRHWLRSRSKK